MHTDHITDFPDFLFLRWTGGARTPLRVFGPPGTHEMVDGFLGALRQDIDRLDGWLKFANIALVPLLIGAGGLGWAAYRRRRTGPAKAGARGGTP